MAYVPGFQYDVFISYRQVDNRFGWVTRLDETLRDMLAQHARPQPDEPAWSYEIYRDKRELGGNEPLPDALRQAVGSSAVLLIVMSQNYLDTDSDWCQRERELFLTEALGGAAPAGRVFIVRMSDVSQQRWPQELQNYVGYPFWEADRTTGDIQPLSFDFEAAGRVPVACQRLGSEIWDTLHELREDHSARSTPPPGSPDAGSIAESESDCQTRPLVFLAEVTDELHNDRAAFMTFLEQEGFQVLPGRNQQYRFQPEAAHTELPPLLTQAALVVQLHGRMPIPSDEQFGGGIEAWLTEQAQAAGKTPGQTLLRWRPFGMRSDDIDEAQPKHRQSVFAADVIAEDLTQFKSRVADRVRELVQRRSIELGGGGAKVIVSTRQDDAHRTVTDVLVDEIDVQGPDVSGQPLESAVVFDDVALEIVVQALEQEQTPPRAIMVVHADADEPWVQARMRECRQYQLRHRPHPPPCAVYVQPPDDQPHPKTVPGRFVVIRHDDPDGLQAFLARIGQEAAG